MSDLEQKWDQGTSAGMMAGIEEALIKCNALLDGKPQESARGLSVRITARLYAMRAKLHLFKREYILADADSSIALFMDPYQAEVCCVCIFPSRPSLCMYSDTCQAVPTARVTSRPCWKFSDVEIESCLMQVHFFRLAFAFAI